VENRAGVGGHFFPSRPGTGLGVCRYNVGVPFIIRDFKPEDFETLWLMDQECFAPGIAYSRQELKLYIRRRGSFTLVAEDETGSIVGFIVVHDGTTGHIITIDVIRSVRRAGVGSLLLRAGEHRLRERGSHAVGLETAVDNISALSFYKRHGYNVIRTWPRYYSNGVDALVMKKELAPESRNDLP
jgi:ribosomal-protein-alanine N-acetyltransferase